MGFQVDLLLPLWQRRCDPHPQAAETQDPHLPGVVTLSGLYCFRATFSTFYILVLNIYYMRFVVCF